MAAAAPLPPPAPPAPPPLPASILQEYAESACPSVVRQPLAKRRLRAGPAFAHTFLALQALPTCR